MSSPGPSLEESLSSLSSTDPSEFGTSGMRRSSFPTPPRVHWFGLVLMGGVVNFAGIWLSRRTGIPQVKDIVSSEVFLYFWLLVQASFVQRLKPGRSILFTSLTAGVLFLAAFLLHDQQRFLVLTGFLAIAASLLLLIDLFRMKHALEEHYNGPEPYGLQLNVLLLFFFGPLYLQYHLLKIAQWKDAQH